MKLEITKKQQSFINSTAFETLYGGAAGGGKSYGQLIDALLYGLKYNGSRQLMLRRTFPELRRSLIVTSYKLFPQEVCTWREADKKWLLKNGSIIEFGYCDSEADVTQYQSAEYDVIRFDELTHFSEFQYVYLISRVRGANNFPKMLKSTTNPGGIGHSWVKSRFIDNHEPNKVFSDADGNTKVFIPARVQDNRFLMKADPNYVKRLEQLGENEKKALLYGDWEIFEGQYFSEFRREIHTIDPFEIPRDWRRYRTMDYGLDMLACLWIALDPQDNAYVYNEVYQPNLIISDAAKWIKNASRDKVELTYAPPDLWNKRQETGKSAYDIFVAEGIPMIKSKNQRVAGWYAVKEWIKPFESKDEQTGEPVTTSKLKIFHNCVNLIRTLPQLQYDKKDPNDVANEPHEFTHAPDALRGFCVMRQSPTVAVKTYKDRFLYRQPEETEFGEVTDSFIGFGVK